jgi:uncharacterized RDD family membrane protein YckC
VDLDDTLTVATAEGLELRLTLAGIGSRFISGAIDVVIQGILTVILVVVCLVIGGGGGLALVVAIIGVFVIGLLYPILFEVLARGRTPGKRLSHLRVLREDGSAVDLQASAIRNIMRLIDGVALLYLPTLIGIAVTRRNQRPGDLAGATIVVREPRAPVGVRSGAFASPPRPSDLARAAAAAAARSNGETGVRLEASAVTPAELAAVRGFLQRRSSLDPPARRELAGRLAAGLRGKVSAGGDELGAEAFLEALVDAKNTQGT